MRRVIVRRDTSARRERILAQLRERGSVQIPALAEQFGVSTQTLRKDLNFLETRGVCTRSPGGALLRIGMESAHEDAIEIKRALFAAEKARIGRAAAALVAPGESLLLDSGTTTLQVARHLRAGEPLVVVTNDVGIMNELVSHESVQLVFLGGTLRRKNMSFYGVQTERALHDLHVDKLFLAADGFHIDKGITTHFEAEALLNRLMCQAASEVIVVTDSSKFGRLCLHKIVAPQHITRVITDEGIPPEVHAALTGAGVQVQIAA
jgi:DeoR family transcriptional regulator, aga operon transcriptional repressor